MEKVNGYVILFNLLSTLYRIPSEIFNLTEAFLCRILSSLLSNYEGTINLSIDLLSKKLIIEIKSSKYSKIHLYI